MDVQHLRLHFVEQVVADGGLRLVADPADVEVAEAGQIDHLAAALEREAADVEMRDAGMGEAEAVSGLPEPAALLGDVGERQLRIQSAIETADAGRDGGERDEQAGREPAGVAIAVAEQLLHRGRDESGGERGGRERVGGETVLAHPVAARVEDEGDGGGAAGQCDERGAPRAAGDQGQRREVERPVPESVEEPAVQVPEAPVIPVSFGEERVRQPLRVVEAAEDDPARDRERGDGEPAKTARLQQCERRDVERTFGPQDGEQAGRDGARGQHRQREGESERARLETAACPESIRSIQGQQPRPDGVVEPRFAIVRRHQPHDEHRGRSEQCAAPTRESRSADVQQIPEREPEDPERIRIGLDARRERGQAQPLSGSETARVRQRDPGVVGDRRDPERVRQRDRCGGGDGYFRDARFHANTTAKTARHAQPGQSPRTS